MKHIYLNLFVLLSFLLTLHACKKDSTQKGPGTSALTIVNGNVGSGFFYINFNGTHLDVPYYRQLGSLSYGFSGLYTNYSGQLNLAFYQVPDTSISIKPIYNLMLNSPVNTIHTLYLMGTSQMPDTLFATEQLPYHPPADSTMGIRFVNISQGSAPVSINLLGQANGSEVQNLPYKSVTAFKNYNAGSAVSSYTFEFRDKSSGNLLGNCVVDGVNNNGSPELPNIRRNQNLTVAFLSVAGGVAPNRGLVVRH